MSTLEHTFAPEEIMAFVDRELPSAEMRAIEAHLAECEECAVLAESFRATSLWMARWDVEDVPAKVEHALAAGVSEGVDGKKVSRHFGLRTWQWWTGGAVTAAAFSVFLVVASTPARHSEYFEVRGTQSTAVTPLPPPSPTPSRAVDKLLSTQQTLATLSSTRSAEADKTVADIGGGGPQLRDRSFVSAAPRIARTASLVVAVRNLDSSRASLERILALDNGYVAQLTAAHAEDGPPTFQASLRIPADRLSHTLTELKSLGRTVTETQGGEEVTQQHMDLVARLHNARETEERYRAILAQHTGKVEDILDVEEHIAEVREQIEQMEAEQATLDHRVDFATVDVQLTQEYKAPLNAPADSVSVRLHNGLVAGYRHVADTLLGLVLFGEEFGPALALWLGILGVPLFLVWRRYLKIRRRVF